MARKRRRKTTGEPKYYCRECSLRYDYDNAGSKWNLKLKWEGRCVTDNKGDKCPLGHSFVEWNNLSSEELPETLEEAIEQGEMEDSQTGEDMLEHFERIFREYKIPNNQFTEEKYDE